MTRPPAGFPKAKRLLHKDDYGRVFAAPWRVSGAYLTVLARTNGTDSPRLGLAISRKAIRRAVDRNRVKRLVRETFRLRQPPLPGLDIVVMARPGCAAAATATLRSSLNQHWDTLSQRCASFSSRYSGSTASC